VQLNENNLMLNKVEMKIVKEIFEESESESKIKIR
jgi:hypothetical protein